MQKTFKLKEEIIFQNKLKRNSWPRGKIQFSQYQRWATPTVFHPFVRMASSQNEVRQRNTKEPLKLVE